MVIEDCVASKICMVIQVCTQANCLPAGHTESDLPNGCAMNGIMLNGTPQSESDPDSDSDEFGQEHVVPGISGNLAAAAAAAAAAANPEHSHKQPSGQLLFLHLTAGTRNLIHSGLLSTLSSV